jgi:DNA polymerase III gamma/tau subunit
MRDALSILDQASLLSMPGSPVLASELLSLLGALPEDILLILGSCILQGDGKSIVGSTERLLMEGREPAAVAAELSSHFLNLLRAFYSISAQSTVSENSAENSIIAGSSRYIQAVCEQAKQADPLELTQIIEQLDQLEQLCRRSTQPAMQFEVGLLSICHRHHIPSLQDLASRVSRLEQAITHTTVQNPATQREKSTIQPKAKQAAVSSHVSGISNTPDIGSADASSSISTIPLEPFWSKLLSTLEEQHRPTWSLVSTHAFPIKVSEHELVIGVAKEQFQKMIETKEDHVRVAARTVTGSLPTLRVRISNDKESIKSASTGNSAPVQDTSSALKEAYRLFEGPGSRQIG